MSRISLWGLISLIAAVLVAAGDACAQPGNGPGKDGKVRLRLISERTAIVPGETNWIGIQYDIEPEWHIYWNGQNDTGAPPTVTPKLPEGYTAGDLAWPAPIRHVADGGLLDHVYEKRIVLLLPVKAPGDAKAGSKITLTVASDWMVCKSSCMLGSGEASITLPIAEAGKTPALTPEAKLIDGARAARLPKPLPADGSALTSAWKDSTLTLTSRKGKKIAFYPMNDSAKPDNLLKGGSSDKGHLELQFEKPGRVLGIVEIAPETGGEGGVRPILYLIDVPSPPGANKSSDGASNKNKSP